jgi:hypothetical protein
MMDETRTRFLTAIASQLQVERVAEIHLFPAIRQGGMESGVAVLALDLATEPKTEPENDPPAEPRVDPGEEPHVAPEIEPDVAPQADPEIEPRVESQPGDQSSEHAASSPYASDDDTASIVAEQLEEAEEEAEHAADAEDDDDEELLAEFDVRDGRADPDEPAPRPAPRRFTVYTARYRHTLKGPDRGKWEVSVTEEADAPLLAVDAVVRGVQRRSGDVDEIVRLTGDEMRAAIPVAAGKG